MIASSEYFPFHTAYIAQLLPSMRQEIARLRAMVAASPAASAPTAVNHTSLLDLADTITNAVDPAFRLFFAYPSRRLSQTLLLRADDLIQAVTWLAERPVSDGPAPVNTEYAACCDRLQRSSRDWRLAIHLETATRDLEEKPLETLH